MGMQLLKLTRLGVSFSAIALGVALGIGITGPQASAVVHAQDPPAALSSGQAHLFRPQGWSRGQAAAGAQSGPSGIFTPTDNLPPGGAFLPGVVMHSTKVFLIFWTPNNTIAQSYKDLLVRFTQDLKGTPFLNITTQYYDNSVFGPDYIHNDVTLNGTFTDTATAYPHAGTPGDPLQDGDIQAEVDHAISVNGWPTGNEHFFAVFTEKGIESCNGGSCTPGVTNDYCAYHNWFNLLDNRIYTNMPFVNSTGWDCNNTNGTPNNADADREVSTFSHELFEAITDPFPNLTWTDGSCGGGVACGEIGDKCAYFFPNAPSAGGSNMTLHGNPYNVQPEWSNGTFTALGGHANDGCTHAYLPADMDIAKAGPSSVYAGGSFDYTINVVSNTSPTAETPHFTDPMDSHLQFQAISRPAGWNCTTPPVGSSGNIDCFRTNNALGDDGSLNSGNAASFVVTSRVKPDAVNGSTISNTGTIAWDTKYAPNNDTAANVHLSKTSSTSATVISQADLTISKSTIGAAYAGLNFSYVIDVESDGPSDAQNVAVTDTLPAGTTLFSTSASGGFVCSGTTTITCTKASMVSGAIASITLTVKIPSSATGTISNTATVSSTTNDPNPANNSSTVVTTVNTEANLSITKTGPATPTAGGNVTYTIVATNLGPSDALVASVNDVVTAPATFVSISGPASWPCSTPAPGASGPIACTKATFPAGASPTFTLVVHLSASAPNGSQLCDTATVTSATTDPVSSNGTSTSCGTVQTSADLGVTQTVTTAGSPGKGTATFSLVVTNNGPSDSHNISLVANSSLFTGPSAGINIAASAGGTCAVAVSNVTCTWNNLALGGSDTVTIGVSWRSAVGQICDSGTISSGTPDPNAMNNNSTVCGSKK